MEVRAEAGRLLARDTSAQTISAIHSLIDSGNCQLVNTVAHVLIVWDRQRISATQRLATMLVSYAKTSPQDALRSSGVMRALAAVKPRGALSGPRELCRTATKTEERDSLLAAGAEMDPQLLAQLMRNVMADPSHEAEWVLRGIFTSNPSSLKSLYRAGRYKEYLYGVQLVPEAEDYSGKARIRKLIHSKNKSISEMAYAVLGNRAIGLARTYETVPSVTPSSSEPLLGRGFETGFQLGDALYRSLITQFLNANHWHAGIFLGFSGEADGTGALVGIHAGRGIGWSDTIEIFADTRLFDSPTTDMADTMRQLRESFLRGFADGRSDIQFHGARSWPNINRFHRKKIACTAASFFCKDIWWTWVDMLDYKGWGWNGTVGDIDETRCDGIVEYSYEKHDIKVCKGHDPNEWKIAKPGTNNVENHNDFHNHAYNQGELCPRIQAGNKGNDSTFETPAAAAHPTIETFSVTPFFLFFAPMIFFTAVAPQSYYVYARLLVRKKGEGSFHFARSEDPYGGMGTPVGYWRLMKSKANLSGEAAFWLGKTAGGPDYRGQDGAFEFRLQVIDQGGNVSDEHSTEVTITWP